MIIIRVTGKPAPQGSKTRNRYGAVYDDSAALGPWRDALRSETVRAVLEQCPNGSPYVKGRPVVVSILFLLKRPASHYRSGRFAGLLRDAAPRRPPGGPDGDKLTRAVFDGITAGGAIDDDRQVADHNVSKDYCRPGETPGCLIRIEAAPLVPVAGRGLFDYPPVIVSPAIELRLGGRNPGLYVDGEPLN